MGQEVYSRRSFGIPSRMLSLMLLIACTGFSSSIADPMDWILKPDEIVVIANICSEDSIRVAGHYMQRRKIPEDHLILIEYEHYQKLEPEDGNPAWLPHDLFIETVVKPVEAFLEERSLKEDVLCFVTVKDTPYRVGSFEFTDAQRAELLADIQDNADYIQANDEEREKLYEKARRKLWEANSASDSELAILFRGDYEPEDDPLALKRKRLGSERNPFSQSDVSFREFRRQQIRDGVTGMMYMVARLDGPTPEIAMGLVDKAIEAEEAGGLQGKFCLDARNKGESRQGYNLGDWWIRHAAEILQKAGLEGTYNIRPNRLGPGDCPAPAIYWGWYELFNYQGEIFENRFPPGAIACHIASYEAARLWKGETKQNGPWCAGLLKDGITITIGPVSEPYLQAFPDTRVFFKRLLEGASVGQAYWASIAHTSWRMILLGDPLYRPFPGGKAAE